MSRSYHDKSHKGEKKKEKGNYPKAMKFVSENILFGNSQIVNSQQS